MVLTGVCVHAAIGFNVETVTYNNIKFQVWDLGGQTSIRPYWRCYYPNTQAGHPLPHTDRQAAAKSCLLPLAAGMPSGPAHQPLQRGHQQDPDGADLWAGHYLCG